VRDPLRGLDVPRVYVAVNEHVHAVDDLHVEPAVEDIQFHPRAARVGQKVVSNWQNYFEIQN
jgi:hypothetical protein